MKHMEERKEIFDSILESLYKSGINRDIASSIIDQIKLILLKEESDDIQDEIRKKALTLENTLLWLYESLICEEILDLHISTDKHIDIGGVTDNIDIFMKSRKNRESSEISLLWETHNSHTCKSKLSGFSLGNLKNLEKINTKLQAKIPLLSVKILEFKKNTEKSLKDSEKDRKKEIILQINKNWLEHKNPASLAEIDHRFQTTTEFIDYISDMYDFKGYSYIIQLLNDLPADVQKYLKSKRRTLDKMNFNGI
jgi:hypothetical protein